VFLQGDSDISRGWASQGGADKDGVV